MPTFNVMVNTTRSILTGLPEEQRAVQARRSTKMLLAGRIAVGPFTDEQIPDNLANDHAVARYLELEPPWANPVIENFQEILNEIEIAYVGGLCFAALSAACVSIERLLNLARMELHKHEPNKIKQLWDKGPSNAWDENIDALHGWGYLDDDFAAELKALYKEVRNRYLHSGEIGDMRADALRSIRAAYRLVGVFLAFPKDLFGFNNGAIACNNVEDPRYKAFFAPRLVPD